MILAGFNRMDLDAFFSKFERRSVHRRVRYIRSENCPKKTISIHSGGPTSDDLE